MARSKHAGTTCLPHGPGLVAGAVQLSDVGFFWEMPGNPAFPKVPWAVTANMMVKNTDSRFAVLGTCISKITLRLCAMLVPIASWCKLA